MNDQKLTHQDIERVASNRANATVYSLNNLYLNPQEKQEVELWYQLPGNVMLYAFVITAIYSVFNPLPWKEIIGIPLIVNIIVGFLNWYFYNKKFVYKLYLTVLHSWILYLVGVGAAIFLFLKGAIILAIISLIAPFGLLALIEPSLYLYSIFAQKYNMHPKFAFFKKEYGHQFPFEKDLD
jgi:hypothetical protein